MASARKKNDKLASASQRSGKRFSSPYYGVSWHRSSQRWAVQIRHGGRRLHVGYFVDEVEAAKGFDEVARSLRGTAARTNFNKEGVLCEEVAKLLRGESQDKYPASSAKSRKRRRSNPAQPPEGAETHQGTFIRTPSSSVPVQQTAPAASSRLSAQVVAAASAAAAASAQASSRAAAASALMNATNSMAALTLPAWPTGMSSGAQLCISSPSTPMHGLPGDMMNRAQAALPTLPALSSDAGDDALNAALDAFAAKELSGRLEAKQRRALDDPWACDAGGSSSQAAEAESDAPAYDGTPSSILQVSSSSRAQPAIDSWFVSQRLRSFRQHIEEKAAATAV